MSKRNIAKCNLRDMADARLFGQMMQVIKDVDYKHYKLSYRKANYEYAINNNKEQAKHFIDESMALMRKHTDDYELIKVLIKHGVDKLFIASIVCVQDIKVYELAGQIYAQYAELSDKYSKISLENYKKYQVLVQNYKDHIDLRGIESINVYSFRPVSEYALADLSNDTITVTRPSRMNDPFDSLANLWKKTTNLKEITIEKGHEDLLSRSMDYYRIRSFVRLKEGETEMHIIGNTLMWSNYANNHYGYCVKYKLFRDFIKKIDVSNGIARRLAPVKYVSDYSIDNSVISIDSYEAYNMKHKIWEYENEIRLLSYNTSTEEDFFSEPMANGAVIEEVIFGFLCPEHHRLAICNILRDKKVSFYHMTVNKEHSIYNLIKEKYIPKHFHHDQT